MGLFKSYEEAGPGIAKNAPKKKGFFRYMEIFKEKFWKLIELNIVYFLTFLPVLAAGVVYLKVDTGLPRTLICTALIILFVLIIGPSTAAVAKILKNYVIEKPTFQWHEYWKTFRGEFKHGTMLGILDCILATCIASAFYVYPKLIDASGSKIYYAFFAITISIGIIALMMNYYAYLMMISTNLSFKNILKNSLALSVVALKTNVITTLILAVFVAVFAVAFIFLDIRYSIMLFALFPFMPGTWMGLVVAQNCYPIIQKYIINPFYEQRGEVNPELAAFAPTTEEGEDVLFEDMGGKEKPIVKTKTKGGSGSAKKHKGKVIS